jgi:hypothetical protein
MADYRKDWWQLEADESVDLSLPGIYEWRIGNEYIYVGQSARLKRRLNEYPNNVRKLLSDMPYRNGKPASFREVHHQLRYAYDHKTAVTVGILENCDRSQMNQREQHWIKVRISEADAGGPRVLNAVSGRN